MKIALFASADRETASRIYYVYICWSWTAHRFNATRQNLYSRKLNSDHIDWQFPTSDAEVVVDPEMLLTECYSTRSPSTFWHFTGYLFTEPRSLSEFCSLMAGDIGSIKQQPSFASYRPVQFLVFSRYEDGLLELNSLSDIIFPTGAKWKSQKVGGRLIFPKLFTIRSDFLISFQLLRTLLSIH